VPSKEIRIVEVEDFDIEACGGTHGHDTSDVWPIKIIKTKKIADGLVRIELKAGSVATEYLKEKGDILKDVADKLKVKEEKVPEAVKELFDTWKSLRKGRK
jgi:alanyl-tRNA synthetase